jgi:hypothetical protein
MTLIHRESREVYAGAVVRGVLMVRPLANAGPLKDWPRFRTWAFKWPERRAAAERMFEIQEEPTDDSRQR